MHFAKYFGRKTFGTYTQRIQTHTNTPTHEVATLVDTAYAAPLATLARIRHNLLVMRSTAKKL